MKRRSNIARVLRALSSLAVAEFLRGENHDLRARLDQVAVEKARIIDAVRAYADADTVTGGVYRFNDMLVVCGLKKPGRP